MSTVNTFRDMSGITQTSALEITPERAQEVIKTVSSNPREHTTSTPITLLQVSTYISESKEENAGCAYVYPKQPPFASHWGIVVGDPSKRGAFLFHLVLRGDGATRRVEFRASNVNSKSEWIVGASVKPVGQTKYSIQELTRIGEEMIETFGSYHLIFWNCQMFAKCYLHIITGDDAVFTQWTSADVTNLFLCALVVPMPLASTSKSNENRKMMQLGDVGIEAARRKALHTMSERENITDEELFEASDAIMDLMKTSWRDDETLKSLSRPMKDSTELKSRLMGEIGRFISKALGLKY